MLLETVEAKLIKFEESVQVVSLFEYGEMYCQIDLSEFGGQKWEIQLVDFKGQEIRKYQTSEVSFIVEKKDLETGIYFLNVKGAKKWGAVKLVVM